VRSESGPNICSIDINHEQRFLLSTSITTFFLFGSVTSGRSQTKCFAASAFTRETSDIACCCTLRSVFPKPKAHHVSVLLPSSHREAPKLLPRAILHIFASCASCSGQLLAPDVSTQVLCSSLFHVSASFIT